MHHPSTRSNLLRFALWSSILCHGIVFAEDEPLTAREIVRRSDDLLRGESSYVTFDMTIERPSWSRRLSMEGWSKGTTHSLLRVLAPPKEKGVGFLKKGREAWQFVPAIDRTIKIPPSMMLQSWMGSDFTNDDVVRADSLVVDYTHEITAEPIEGDLAYWIVEADPKPNAPVVWGKVVFKVLKSNFVPVRVDYYDEDGALVKYYETSDVRTIEGRELATKLVMHDVSRPGYQTTVHYRFITFSPDLKSDTFSLRNLEQ